MLKKGRLFPSIIKCRKMSRTERAQEQGTNEKHSEKGKKNKL
jgi:hypothetical protein